MERRHVYGTPSHRGTANVRVSVTNVNDEDPVFIQPVEHVLVSVHRLPSPEQLASQGRMHLSQGQIEDLLNQENNCRWWMVE